ncbi:glycosyltransferase family 2 protein [Thiofaba sp. EF100]|uniref:glycosyltransferase family 2 protein n=1 Tax=Thiofaba sp. EF100 TaxID=3121274 RepID=UPI0032219F19
MTSSAQHRLSLVIPMYNEQDNVLPMLERVHEVLGHYPMPWEVLLVNDGSSDGTLAMMREGQAKYGEHVRVVELRRNFGQTAAMQAGIDLARGDVIATLDGDLQNDPIDIPRMVNRLLDEDLDLVAGWRKNRQDAVIMRKIPSRIANKLIRRITGVQLHDYGCSLKVFRAEVVKNVRLYGEMHRFIPAWLATYTAPNRIAEEVVQHHPRTRGVSKYGISRTFRVIIDLLVVYFFMRFSARPGHFFGMVGLGLGGLGGLIMAYMVLLKLLGEDIGTRPLFFTGILLILVGVQMLTTGVVAEMLSRVYFESQERKSYIVRNKDAVPATDDEAWCEPPPA